ncbi:MAG: heme-binding protein [Acidobacteria bacterium]|nr:heme-binding protein [Acidobacteriota bacterium]
MPESRGTARWIVRATLPCVALALQLLWPLAVRTQSGPGGPAQILTAADVVAIITVAAESLGDDTMAVGVVDRTGTILGVYRRSDAGPGTPDVAVSLARTGGFFSNDQAPLSSRTVRFISGIHYPPGVSNTANAALYGIENTNRGCQVDGVAPALGLTPPRSIAGTVGTGAGTLPLPCGPLDTRGCARGGPVADLQGRPLPSVGITTGKADLFDTGRPLDVPVNPGGMPIFRNGQVVGGVGVAGVTADRAEYAATLAAAGSGRGLGFPDELPRPGAVFLDGIQLPFFGTCRVPIIACVGKALRRRPPGSAPGRFSQGTMTIHASNGIQAPEGYVIGPRASGQPGGLTRAEVERLVSQGVASANSTRAQIRLPFGHAAQMVIAVADQSGDVLAAFRMADAPWFSLDVSIAKSRNAYYFSSREGYELLRDFVDTNPHDDYRWEPDPPPGQGWAVTNRTLSFGGQPLFPPGIDLDTTPTPGPWFDLFVYDSLHPCTEGPGRSRGQDRRYLNQSGIVWFPGSVPLYRNGALMGGLGVSGDGVEQDDFVASTAAAGFEPPDALRVDNSVIRTGSGKDVRLPYLKFPRNPTQR